VGRVDNGLDEPGRQGKPGSIPPRVESRLSMCVERAKAAGCPSNTGVVDVVALVGGVGESVETLLSRNDGSFPLLKQMFNAGRFVFFLCQAVIPVGSPLVSGAP
jgi:hypothetical protein